MSPLALAAWAGMLMALAAAAAWWASTFLRLLPRDRALRRREAELETARALAARLLDGSALAARPAQALTEAAARALDALHGLHPDAALAVIVSPPGGGPALLAHRGGAWAQAPLPSLRFDAGLLARAAADGAARWDGGWDAGDPLACALADLGFAAAEAHAWTGPAGPGALVAAAFARGPALELARPDLQLSAAALRSAAALSAGVARVLETREKLEAGLTEAERRLTQTQDRLIKQSKEIRTLHDVAQALTAAAGQDLSSLGAIVSVVARSLEADLVAFLLLDESAGELVTQPGAFGVEGEELLYRIPLTDRRSSSVRVFTTRKPYVTGDAQNDPGVGAISNYPRMLSIQSVMVVPLVVEGRGLGVMRVGSRRLHAFGDDQLRLVSVIAEEAAILVETAMLNRKLSEAAEQLTALNRMKDEFVSTVSHEFKTPLTTITGFLTVILDGDTGHITEQQMRFLRIAQASAKRLSGLVSDLLDLSKLEGGARMEMRPIDMTALLSASVDNHLPLAAEGDKRLRWTAPLELPSAVGDGRWLGLVVDNLVSNAVKFTRPGGSVSVSAQDKGEFVMVSVADDGIGIPEEDREKIFERFYRASNRGEVNAPGTGLGLAIAREVVAKHGGKIWFDSEPGRGSTFHFIVPAAREEAAA